MTRFIVAEPGLHGGVVWLVLAAAPGDGTVFVPESAHPTRASAEAALRDHTSKPVPRPTVH